MPTIPAMMPEAKSTAVITGMYNNSWTVESFAVSSASLLVIDETLGVTVPTVTVNQTQKTIKELLYNGTGYYIDDESEPGKYGLN